MHMADDVRGTMGVRFPALQSMVGIPLQSHVLDYAFGEKQEMLRRVFVRCGAVTVGDLIHLTYYDLLDLRGVGPTKAAAIVEALRSMAMDAVWMGPGMPDPGRAEFRGADAPWMGLARSDLRGAAKDEVVAWDLESLGPDTVDVIDAEIVPDGSVVHDESIATLIAWARQAANVETWGDLLQCLRDRTPPAEVATVLGEVTARILPEVDLMNAASFLESWFGLRADRDLEILDQRVLAGTPATLEVLGDRLGVTRERVRQVESKLVSELQSEFRTSPEWRSVRWAVDELTERCGAFCPARQAPGRTREERMIRWLAGLREAGAAVADSAFVLPTAPNVPRSEKESSFVDEPATDRPPPPRGCRGGVDGIRRRADRWYSSAR